MNNEFTYYKVQWLEKDVTGFWNTNNKRLYFKDEALEYKELIDKSDHAKNCIVKKITEIIEVIS